MSSNATVLFDAPGPRTVRRHRLYTGLTVLGLLGLLALAVVRLNAAGQFAYDQWEVFITPRFVEAILVDGILVVLQMAAAAVVLSVIFGLIFGVAKLSPNPLVRVPATYIVEFFRAVPVLLLMIFIFFSYGVTRGDSGAYWTVVVALMLYNGSVLAEVVRAGINAVPKGQSEAGLAIGLSRGRVTRLILLPQAVKIMLPAIISQCVVALKDTSLGYAVAAPGLVRLMSQIYQQFGNQFATLIVTAALYIIMCTALTLLATWVQRRYVGVSKTPAPNVAITDMDTGLAARGV
ncbi:amino acid ABC transporter permease [Alteromonas gracilis]